MQTLQIQLPRTIVVLLATAAFWLVVGASSAHAAPTLIGTVGPGHSISLRTASGVDVRTVAAGRTYTLVLRDLSTGHNFHVAGPGFGRQTTVPFRGEQRYTVAFRAGTFGFHCDPHTISMFGSFRARTV